MRCWSSLRPALTWRLRSSTSASGSPASSASSAALATAAGAILSISSAGGEVGVDEADVDADDLGALAL